MKGEELLVYLMKKGSIPKRLQEILKRFLADYISALEKVGKNEREFDPLLKTYIDLIESEIKEPYHFQPFHEKIVSPFNHYQFGLDLIRPLVNLEKSQVKGLENLDQIESKLTLKENVILFSNHQTEPDPQAICLLLEKTHPKLAENMIFVAGHRVTTDPLATPLSKGLNLFCIYSKKRMEHPPEEKMQKLQHNQRTIQKMSDLLSEGGKCIWVAPSGGRDRADETGKIHLSYFDPQSIELFRLLKDKCTRPTHFYPLALSTYDLLPPPSSVDNELGEERLPKATPLFLSFGRELDLSSEEGSSPKAEIRKKRAEKIWNQINEQYKAITKN